MTAHRRVLSLEEQRTAALQIMGQPTYSWFEGENSLYPSSREGMELIFPVGIFEVRFNRSGGNPVIYLKVWEFYRGRWDEVNWSMRNWSFQTVASYNEFNDLNEENLL